jgi:hypothetical protein
VIRNIGLLLSGALEKPLLDIEPITPIDNCPALILTPACVFAAHHIGVGQLRFRPPGVS